MGGRAAITDRAGSNPSLMAEVSGWRIRILRGRSPFLVVWVMVPSDGSALLLEAVPAVLERTSSCKDPHVLRNGRNAGTGIHSVEPVFLRETERPVELPGGDGTVQGRV